MIKVLKHVNSKDKQALAVFWGLALLCFLYFASGILVTYVSSPDRSLEMTRPGKEVSVRVEGLKTYASAKILSEALQEQRHVPAVIEPDPSSQGYMIKIGPLSDRGNAENLTNELRILGYDKAVIVESCLPGTPGCTPAQPDSFQKD